MSADGDLTRQKIEEALQTIADLVRRAGDTREEVVEWGRAWGTVNSGIWADLAVTVVTPEGMFIRVLPEVPETGPDRLDAIAITFDKTDTRRHQLLRLAHEWRTNP